VKLCCVVFAQLVELLTSLQYNRVIINTLSWSPPEFPQGIITRYDVMIVNVSIYSTTTTQFDTSVLPPGVYYAQPGVSLCSMCICAYNVFLLLTSGEKSHCTRPRDLFCPTLSIHSCLVTWFVYHSYSISSCVIVTPLFLR